jgi:hydroxymethylbilane synthase
VGQGALAVATRAGDDRIRALLADFHDPFTAACTAAERAFLAALEGGCQIPIGALATEDDEGLTLYGLVADTDGETVLRDSVFLPVGEGDWLAAAPRLGRALADRLLAMGAGEVLARARGESPRVPEPAAP